MGALKCCRYKLGMVLRRIARNFGIPFAVFIINTLLTDGCSEFPTRFEHINDDKVRVLDFIYRNGADSTLADAAPGDTMELTAVFAGARVHTVEWRISYDIAMEKTGMYPDFQDHATGENTELLVLSRLSIDTAIFGDGTYTERIRFAIPDTVMRNNPNIPDEPFEQIGISREDGFMLLDSLLDKPISRWFALFTASDSTDSLKEYIALLAQQLTLPVRITAVVNGTYEIHSNFSVRYNRRLSTWFPGVKPNRNPDIRWAGIYKVAGSDKATLSPEALSDRDTFFCLFTESPLKMPNRTLFTDTLLIEKGFSYFVAVDSGIFGTIDLRDTGTIIDTGTIDIHSPETWFSQWFIGIDQRLDDLVAPEDLPIISSTRQMSVAMGAPIEPLFPPGDKRITSLDLWVQVFDAYLGERFRPYGSDLKSMKVYLKYAADW